MRIRIQNLSKTYGRGGVLALSDLNLEIRHGTFGLLGPNGAGKTTLIKILSTQMAPSAGAVEINGWDLQRDCAQVRRRLGIAQVILAEPEFIIVDEPTVGLDPEERIRFRAILGKLSASRTILISTHIVGDISSTCEDLAILHQGRLRFHGAPADFVAKAEGKTWLLQTDDAGFEAIAGRFNVVTISADGGGMALRLVGDAAPPPSAVPTAPNLEDAYIYFMGSA